VNHVRLIKRQGDLLERMMDTLADVLAEEGVTKPRARTKPPAAPKRHLHVVE
jgi:hypothetical protein